MPELSVTSGPASGQRILLVEGRSYAVGSDPEAALRIDGLAAEQFVVKPLKGGGFGAKAVAGPFEHNGRPTQAARLADGDAIRVGASAFRFGANAAAEPDSQPPAPPAAEQPPKTIAGFRLLGPLGKGGMGVVYRAEQISLGREVALKVLSKELTSDPVFVARFVAEARAAARLHHPNVVQVFDVGHDGDTYYYSMELMAAGSVEARLRQQGRIATEEAVGIVADAARGLAFAEELRIVHRDIKPDNLMIDQHGHIKLADLGLAMTDEDDQSKVVGTPHFMAPEQALRKPLDHRSDLYSLGCTFYRLVTGKNPFPRDSVKQILVAHVKEEAPLAHKVQPDVPAEVAQIIATLMAKDPGERYQSAHGLIEDLEALMAPPVRRGLVLGAVAAAIVFAGVAIWYVATREPPRPVIIDNTDHSATEEAQRRLREERARAALLELRLRGLQGEAFATELDDLAAAHEGTEAAGQARQEATRVRDEVARAAAAAAAREEQVGAELTRLAGAFERALQAEDVTAAAAVLDPAAVAEALRGDPRFAAQRAELMGALTTFGERQIAALRAKVDGALQARDVAAAAEPLAALRALCAPDGWPDAAVGDRAALQAWVTGCQQQVAAVREELAAAREAEAWTRFRDAAVADGGLLALLARLDAAGAHAAAQRLQAELGDSQAGAYAASLGAACEHANRYRAAFDRALAEGRVLAPYGEGDPVPVVAFAATGAEAGFTIRLGPNHTELLPLARAGELLGEIFAPLDGIEAVDREAFLAATAVGAHVAGARRYFATLRADDDESGTGTDAYAVNDATLTVRRPALDASEADWAQVLRRELTATRVLVRGLRALSTRRNRAAHDAFNRLLGRHAGTLAVRALR